MGGSGSFDARNSRGLTAPETPDSRKDLRRSAGGAQSGRLRRVEKLNVPGREDQLGSSRRRCAREVNRVGSPQSVGLGKVSGAKRGLLRQFDDARRFQSTFQFGLGGCVGAIREPSGAPRSRERGTSFGVSMIALTRADVSK